MHLATSHVRMWQNLGHAGMTVQHAALSARSWISYSLNAFYNQFSSLSGDPSQGRAATMKERDSMSRSIRKLMRAVYGAPNGLQVTDRGIWVVDQLTDRAALVENTEADEYGVTRILHEIATESSTTSGITYGEDALWLAANGPGERWRTTVVETDE